MDDLPACGIYRTRHSLSDELPAGRLVFFHNHGEPGPGVYLPASWNLNRAQWQKQGVLLVEPDWARQLEPLAPEGFYRVREAFHCCAKECRRFEADLLVQLGYDAQAHHILFVPEWTQAGLAIPESGTLIDAERVSRLAPLKVVEHAAHPGPEEPQ